MFRGITIRIGSTISAITGRSKHTQITDLNALTKWLSFGCFRWYGLISNVRHAAARGTFSWV